MLIPQLLGFGSKKLISQGAYVHGTVTNIQKCWWIRINPKPIRSHALDGAIFPHIITYEYDVSGKNYCGRQMISAYKRCPQIHETVRVFYDPFHPAKATLYL